MQENYKDILSGLSTDIDQELLMQYLQGKLPAAQKHEIEKKLMQSEFEEDALEGLEEFRDKEQLQYMVEALNRDLKKKTEKKQKKRSLLKFKNPWLLWLSVLLLILLIVVCYYAILHVMSANNAHRLQLPKD